MRCDFCNTNKAEIHTLEKVQGEWVQHSICEQCAHGGLTAKNLGMQGAVDPQTPEGSSKVFQFFGQILAGSLATPEKGAQPAAWPQAKPGSAGASCPGCGMSYARFQELRRLGCSRCYETFQAELEELLLRVHDDSMHRGKVPGRPLHAPPSPAEIQRLKEKLDRAIQDERFEDAALFRDKLRQLLEQDGESEPST